MGSSPHHVSLFLTDVPFPLCSFFHFLFFLKGMCTSCLFIGENCEWEIELLGKFFEYLKLDFWKPVYFCLESDGFRVTTVDRTFFTFLHLF